jgi:hypothetical protein
MVGVWEVVGADQGKRVRE